MSSVTGDMLRAYADSDGLGLAALVRKGEVSPIELVETAVATVEKLNPQLNAVISKLYDMGRAAAHDVDRNAPFAGVPYLLKELRTRWKDAPVTGSSSYLRNVRADSDTEVVKRIKAAGFLLVGKSNAPEPDSTTTQPTPASDSARWDAPSSSSRVASRPRAPSPGTVCPPITRSPLLSTSADTQRGSGSSTGASPAQSNWRMLSGGSTATGRGSASIMAATVVQPAG